MCLSVLRHFGFQRGTSAGERVRVSGAIIFGFVACQGRKIVATSRVDQASRNKGFWIWGNDPQHGFLFCLGIIVISLVCWDAIFCIHTNAHCVYIFIYNKDMYMYIYIYMLYVTHTMSMCVISCSG